MTDDDLTQYTREAEDDVTKRPTEDKAEKRREDAFNAGYNWRGVTFEGLTCSRKDLWTSLCYKAGFPPISAAFDNLQLFVPLAKALVWACVTPSKELRRLRSLGMDATHEAFIEWADANVRLSDERAILDLGQQILIDANDNQAEAAPSGIGSGK